MSLLFCFCSSIHSVLFFLLPVFFSALGDKDGRFSCFQKVGERTNTVVNLMSIWKGKCCCCICSGLKYAEAVSLFALVQQTANPHTAQILWFERKFDKTIKCLSNNSKEKSQGASRRIQSAKFEGVSSVQILKGYMGKLLFCCSL